MLAAGLFVVPAGGQARRPDSPLKLHQVDLMAELTQTVCEGLGFGV